MTQKYITKWRHRGACIHEAGHAVVAALTGCRVSRVAVLPAGHQPKGSSIWTRTGLLPQTDQLEGDIGTCCVVNMPGANYVRWNEDRQKYDCDAIRFRDDAAESRRHAGGFDRLLADVRASICISLGGVIAQRKAMGGESCLEDDFGGAADGKRAIALSSLLPSVAELFWLHEQTQKRLSLSGNWDRVFGLAEELARHGEVTDIHRWSRQVNGARLNSPWVA